MDTLEDDKMSSISVNIKNEKLVLGDQLSNNSSAIRLKEGDINISLDPYTDNQKQKA